MEEMILCKKTKGAEFNLSEEEKFLMRQIPAGPHIHVGCWLYKVPVQGSLGAVKIPLVSPDVCSYDMLGYTLV